MSVPVVLRLAPLACLLCAAAGAEAPPDMAGAAIAPAINEHRMLGVLPNYQTVADPNAKVLPLTRAQKWNLAFRETVDPFNFANAALAAGFSQLGDDTPKYGQGMGAYGMRFGAAFGDFAAQNAFSAGVLACLLHQDPRYFRKGPQAGILSRVVYSVSRLAITRQDSGAAAFNASGILGMALGIGASNLYYPSASIHGSVMTGRVITSLTGGVIGNLMAEFLPDLQRKFLHRKTR